MHRHVILDVTCEYFCKNIASLILLSFYLLIVLVYVRHMKQCKVSNQVISNNSFNITNELGCIL